MRYFFAVLFFVLISAFSLLGLRGKFSRKPPLEVFPDMDRQAKFLPQAANEFYVDGRADRPAVPGTIARGNYYENDFFATGRVNGEFAPGFPVPVTNEMMELGQEKYQIFCAVCHSQTGDGNGITKIYGMVATPSYHSDMYRDKTEGEIFNTITYGKNTMQGYGSKLTPEERWAVIAYLRALQRAQNATIDDVPTEHRKDLGL